MSIDDPQEWSRRVAAVRAGEADAGEALVEALYPLVIRIVRSHRPRQCAEEDVAQEIFIKLFGRLDQYGEREGVPFTHWVSRLAVRTCLDRLRAERRRPEVRQSDLTEDEAEWLRFLAGESGGAVEGPDATASEVVGRLLERLSVEDRLVIQWLDLEQKSVREISELTGWSRPAVKVRAFRARRRLRRVADALRVGMQG